MFFLKSVISFLVLPPINLALAVFAGFLLLRTRPCLGRWIIGVASGLLLLLAMPAVSGFLIFALEQNLPLHPPADAPPGAIVILGGEMKQTGGAHPGFAVGPLTLERLRAGARLFRKTHLPVLVTGGVLKDNGPPIAELMARSLEQDFHVPVRWIEPRSRDTWQNAAYSAVILRKAGIRSVYVVTHAWHERRAMIAFRRAGLTATAAPVRLDRYALELPDSLVPTASAWLESFYALHEWVGCVWYSLP